MIKKPIIKLDGLTKRYQGRIAVDRLTMDIFEGECFSLLGLNGAGKTTTIKMLSGLSKPTSGDAIIDGKSILSQMLEIKHLINLSPQETAIAPNLSVYENLIFMAEIYGFSKTEAMQKAQDLMSSLNLLDRKTDKAKKLSGGLKRRLSIAMALITNPKILFLDEPTLGLDVRARRELWHYIRQIKANMTIILTSHYLDEVEALADRIAIMDQGQLKMIGTLADLQAKTQFSKLDDIFLSVTSMEEIL